MRILLRLFLFVAFCAVVVCSALVYWALRPIPLPADRVDFTIPPGTSIRGIARELQSNGVDVNPELFAGMARLSGLDKRVKAGSYELSRADSAWRLLQRMAEGDISYARVTFIEGWTYRKFRAALADNPDVKQTLTDVSDAELLAMLGAPVDHPEGLFFPDTYTFAKGSSDFDILRRAYQAQQQQLHKAWERRAPNHPLQSPYELLILASIIEKETGLDADRPRIAGVFLNRLRRGMPLQTDPTVIYGMGEQYDGRLLRKHLQVDNPWNTYTRNGLPPTPIASPGRASLEAAAQPESHRYYYFVARGDGTSAFSEDLNTHNRYVNQYIRGANR